MHWMYLFIAIIFEIILALALRSAKGLTRLWSTVLVFIAAIGGIYTLSLALLTLDVSIGYTIWTGAGSVGAVIFSVIFFGEKLNPIKIGSFISIIVGVAGLKLLSGF